MSDHPNDETLRRLLNYRGRCVSIYMPTHRAGREVAQDPIRLKNLLRRAEAQGGRLPKNGGYRTILDAPRTLAENSLFWRHQSDGLALFSYLDSFDVFRLPASFPEVAMIGDRFHLKPLLAYLCNDPRAYVLALSLDHVRLLEACRTGLDQVECPGLPSSLDDAVPEEDREKVLQLHTHGRGGRSAVFHGQEGRHREERLLRFLRICDVAVSRRLRAESAPLLLACLDQYAPLYRRVNSYPHLDETKISGNPDSFGTDELFAQVRTTIERLKLERERSAAERYREGKPSGQASHHLNDVLVAATQGRLASVFVPEGARLVGRWRPDLGKADLTSTAEGACDLLDLLAAETYLHGGEVLTMAKDEMPDSGVVAGVFRY